MRTLPAILLLAVWLTGCETQVISEKSSFDWLTDLPQLTVEGGNRSPQPAAQRRGNQDAGPQAVRDAPTAWAVRLARYQGPFRYDNANLLLQRISEQTDLTETWVSDIDGAAAVYCGRFRDPQSTQASETLARIRALELGGERVFAQADLYPLGAPGSPGSPGAAGRGFSAGDPWDMSGYPGHYTVVINYYTDDFEVEGMDRYDAAETAVKQLRSEGYPAFFWHRPKNSRVCIGNFTHEQAWDAVPDPLSAYQSTVEAYTADVEDIRAHFPQLSANGVSLIQRQGDITAPVPTSLSRVPVQ